MQTNLKGKHFITTQEWTTDELETIFEPFVRSATNRQAAGFGLGLAIARRAIETHHGSIRALNRPEGGLRIEITLPVSSGRSSAIDSRRAQVRHR